MFYKILRMYFFSINSKFLKYNRNFKYRSKEILVIVVSLNLERENVLNVQMFTFFMTLIFFN